MEYASNQSTRKSGRPSFFTSKPLKVVCGKFLIRIGENSGVAQGKNLRKTVRQQGLIF
jgi:hypothetical protein